MILNYENLSGQSRRDPAGVSPVRRVGSSGRPSGGPHCERAPRQGQPTYTPHVDTGAFVIVINAEKAVFTGRKGDEKIYVDYTGYRSGYKERTAKELRDRSPERFIKDAVWGMMPHGRLGRAQFSKLKVYAGAEHPHTAQKPTKVTVSNRALW